MPYSAEPLPEQPEQKKDSDHPAPLVRLTVYGTEAVLLVALANPVHDLPYGIQHDNPHTETRQPSTRVDDLRTIGAASTSVASSSLTSFNSWFTTRGST